MKRLKAWIVPSTALSTTQAASVRVAGRIAGDPNARQLPGSPGSLIAYRLQSWRFRGRLETLIEEIGSGAGPEEVIAHLESVVEDVARAIGAIRSGQR